MKLTFLGAAGEVTGSQHLLETSGPGGPDARRAKDGLRVLLDCGLFQGRRAECFSKNSNFKCGPKTLDAVILSHAHIDHCGNLPGLVKAGFDRPIFCTKATADVAELMLLDSAKIQAEEVRYLSGHLRPGHPPIDPLYDREHVRRTRDLFEPLEFGTWHDLAPDFRLRFHEAGHILGSAITELEIREQGTVKRVVFTGDLGRRDLPLLHDPQTIAGCDVLISESTYGNRVHPPAGDLKAELLRIVSDAVHRGGRVIVPAFSLGRTQNVVYFLNQLYEEELLPRIPVFVDSPLSVRLTDVYRRHQEELDEEAQRMLRRDDDLFDFPQLVYVESQEESAALNRRKGPCVIVSASGMCENGRIRHHLKHGLPHAENTVLLIGFQAPNTLGRRLLEGRERVRIFDRDVPVRARIVPLGGLSAHADVEDFKWWFGELAKGGGIGRGFLVHGEPEAAAALAPILRDCCDEEVTIPQYGESFEV